MVLSTGLVHKLGNHTKEFGTTDALVTNDDLLVSSGFDLDNGLGFINCKSRNLSTGILSS